jgi:thiamine-phosphate pyrophosphorylase
LTQPAGRAWRPGGPDRWCLDERRLYLCTPDRPDLAAFVSACIDGGVDIVQLRDKALSDGELLDRAAVLQHVCGEWDVPFILNDRPDLAARSGADGVHVGQDDESPATTRRLIGTDAIVGLSTHSTTDLEGAIGAGTDRAPVDYISAGPVVPTPTKPGRPGTGTAYIREAIDRSPWPVWITGGVTPESVPALVEAGARHFVVVRWLTEAADPRSRAQQLRERIDAAIEQGDSLTADRPPTRADAAGTSE